MIADVKAIRGKGTDCFQDIIITLCEYWGIKYDLFFCESLNFRFQKEYGKNIGECLESERKTTYDLAEKYHGLVIEYKKFNSSLESLNYILNNINADNFFAIYLDAFYTPWHPHGSYRTNHGDHACLVVGYDQDQSLLYCVDPVYSPKIEKLSHIDFFDGNSGQIFLFKKNDPVEIHSTDYDIIVSRIKYVIENNNRIQDILVLADSFIKEFDINNESKNITNFWEVPIWKELDKILFGRYYFYKFILFLSYHNNKVELIAEDALLSYRRWEMIRSIVTKIFFTKKSTKEHVIKIHNYLNEIYICEKRIRDYFFDTPLLQKIDNRTLSYTSKNGKLFSYTSKKGNLLDLDIKHLYNNKTFMMEYEENNVSPDFNDGGSYIILGLNDKAKFNRSINENDNIKCENQLIEIPIGYYSHILLRGCSEFGGCYTDFKMQYETSNVTHQIYFSDWIDSEHSEYNLAKYWTGKNDEGLDVYIKEFTLTINPFERLKSITLPSYSNLHIFSIIINSCE